MIRISDLIASFIGGIFVGDRTKFSIITRLLVYFIILVFFEIFLYIDFHSDSEENTSNYSINLIATGILTFFIFLIKLTIWALNYFIKLNEESSDSIELKTEERPDNIPPEIWQYHDTIVRSKRPRDLVISDLLASGVDPTGLMNLVNYIQSEDHQISEVYVNKQDDKKYMINICGRSYDTKLNPGNINKIFPSTTSFLIVLYSTLLCFAATYFSISIKSCFSRGEKWWVAIVCTISIYSILYPVDSDPYSTKIPDQLTGCSRPLALFIIAGLLDIVTFLDEKYVIQKKIFIISFFYDVSVKWEIISPYLNDILHYGLIFLPFLVFAGFVGHPLSVVISIIESFNRYIFGQCGVSNILHLVIQLVRGSASVAINWSLLQYKFNGPTLAISISISTLLATFPIFTSLKKACTYIIYYCYPILITAISFLLSFCIVDLAGNRWDIISWFSFGWILLIDVIFPYFYSNEKYFFFHFRLIRSFRGSILIRNITQLIITPLFVSSALHYNNKYIRGQAGFDIVTKSEGESFYSKSMDSFYTSSNLPKLMISCAIVHSIQKANTEPHIFALVIWLTVITLPYEFDLQFPAVNFIISMLIATKLEVFIPQVEFALHSRNASFLFKNDDEKPFFLISILIQILNSLFQMFPSADLVLKIPALIWSFITGASFISIKGTSFALSFAPIRPTYFFDWPVRESNDLEAIFTKKVSEHPLEAPVYTSVSYSLSSKLATIIRSGRLGLVNNGDMFLMQESSSLLTILVHIIVIEPYCIKMQIRGLEYMNRTICHAEEDLFLYEMIKSYETFPNFNAAAISSCAAYDIRALGIPLKMYENTKTNVKEAFIGLEPELNVKILIASFCHTFKSLSSAHTINVQEEFQPLPNEISDSEDAQHFHNSQNFDYFIELIRNGNSINDNEINLLFDLFVIICMNMLDDTGRFIIDNIVNAYNGNINFKEEFSWIYDSNTIYNDLVIQTIRKGIVVGFLASSGFLNEDESIEDIENFVDEVCQTYIITTFDSPAFRSAFIGSEDSFDYSSKQLSQSTSSISSKEDEIEKTEKYKSNKRKKIIIIDKINDEEVVLRFTRNPVKWNVLKIKHEWVRALWGNDTMDILFYRNTNAERMSIQYNKLYLNNMILQACDFPIGYPAFVSKIMDSFIHPYSIQKFQS